MEPRFKRPFDIALSLFGLIIFFPFFIIIPVLIKVEDGGRVFFVQNRWGKKKTQVKIYKFRTMRENIDNNSNIQAARNDSRITRIGNILRMTALDELPQLIHILLGQMSFVGPRVLPINETQINENERYRTMKDDEIPGFEFRSRVRPGLTGIAQVFAARDVSRKNKFRYDRVYINNMSLVLDIKLIFYAVYITIRNCFKNIVNR